MNLNLAPPAQLASHGTIKMDATGWAATLAVTGHMLERGKRAWAPHLKNEQYRLWISKPQAQCGKENAKLKPGCRAPK